MQAIRDNGKKLKILLLESGPNWGGQEERLLREASWLRQKGHKVLLACSDKASIAGRARDAGVDTRTIPFRSNFDFAGILALAKLVRREKPDLLHARSSKDAWFSFWFHLAGIPVVRSRHITLPDAMPWGRRFVYRYGCRRLIAAAGFIATAMRDLIGFPPDRIDVVGECVDTNEFSPGDGSAFRREFGIPQTAPLFGIVAMLRAGKGHDVFLAAAKRVLAQRPDVRFVIVGSAAPKDGFGEKIRRTITQEFGDSPDPSVIMTGFQKDIPLVMRALDCLVVPSKKEAQSIVIPQAFATGKPVIGSEVGGIPELIRHRENGLLFPPRDHDALAAAMLEIAADPQKADSLGRAGRKLAEDELATDRKMELLLASYHKCLATR